MRFENIETDDFGVFIVEDSLVIEFCGNATRRRFFKYLRVHLIPTGFVSRLGSADIEPRTALYVLQYTLHQLSRVIILKCAEAQESFFTSLS